MPPPPPPPPPPICLPFFGKKKGRRLTYTDHTATEDYSSRRSSIDRLGTDSYSPTATLTSRAEKLTFSSETESFNVHNYSDAARDVTPVHPTLKRSNTIGTAKDKSATPNKRWGYGWGLGKKDKNQAEIIEKPHVRSAGSTPPPVYNSPGSETRSRATRSGRSHSSQASSQLDYDQPGGTPGGTPRRARSVSTNGGSIHYIPPPSNPPPSSPPPSNPKRSNTYKSNTTKVSGRSGRPTLYPSESSSTLVGSALERKFRDEDPVSDRPDTTSRLDTLRDLMRTHSLDY